MPTSKKGESGAGRFGLVLDLPGAANAPHMIPGVHGEFRPDVPTPVGGKGEMPLEMARRLDKDPRVHVKLVPLGAAGDEEG